VLPPFSPMGGGTTVNLPGNSMPLPTWYSLALPQARVQHQPAHRGSQRSSVQPRFAYRVVANSANDYALQTAAAGGHPLSSTL